MPDFTDEEENLIEYARSRILEYCRMRKEKGLHDKIFAFALSESGEIYEGITFDSNQPQYDICAEKHALANMAKEETEKANLKSILVAGPVPRDNKRCTKPCGSCRHVIHENATEETSVICTCFVRKKDDWEMFPDFEKFNVDELYPNPFEPVWE